MEPEGSLPHSQASATFPILGQPNPVHIPTSHLLEIHPNIIHPSTPRSLHWSLSLRFPHQDPIRLPLLTHTHHMPSPSHSSRFYHPHNIGWAVQIIKLLVMQSPPFPRYLVPPMSKYSPQHRILGSLYLYIYINIYMYITNLYQHSFLLHHDIVWGGNDIEM